MKLPICFKCWIWFDSFDYFCFLEKLSRVSTNYYIEKGEPQILTSLNKKSERNKELNSNLDELRYSGETIHDKTDLRFSKTRTIPKVDRNKSEKLFAKISHEIAHQ